MRFTGDRFRLALVGLCTAPLERGVGSRGGAYFTRRGWFTRKMALIAANVRSVRASTRRGCCIVRVRAGARRVAGAEIAFREPNTLQDNTVSELERDFDTQPSARRKLVRGVFAAPAILTLQSGSAFAATSAGSCLVKQNLSPSTQPATAADDTWFRYQLWVVKNNGGQIESSWIKGADLSVYVRAGQTPFLSNGQWQQFDLATNALLGSPALSPPSIGINQTLTQTGSWVSLRVNSTGALVGAGVSGTGSAVSDSCWNSFAAATT